MPENKDFLKLLERIAKSLEKLCDIQIQSQKQFENFDFGDISKKMDKALDNKKEKYESTKETKPKKS